mgnify:CR=1 FL=1
MVQTANAAISEEDVIAFVIEACQWRGNDIWVLELLQKCKEQESFSVDFELKYGLKASLFSGLRSESDYSREKRFVENIEEKAVESNMELIEDYPERESIFREILIRFQGVFIAVLILALSGGLYFGLTSQNLRIERLLKNEAVSFIGDFSEQEKYDFSRQVLLYLIKNDRSNFISLSVEKKNWNRLVLFNF